MASTLPAPAEEAAFIDAMRRQVDWCDRLGSPFTARVIEVLIDDWLGAGATRAVVPAWHGDPAEDALPLRLAAGLHSLVVTGADDALAGVYPPTAAKFDADRAPQVIRDAMHRHEGHVRSWLEHPPQTNEIGRSAVLLGGFATIARETGLPLALLEIGASAGLNQWWDRYRYDLGNGLRWGNADSAVLVRSQWTGDDPAALPELPARIDVASRRACDRAPIDLQHGEAATRLQSYVWADQVERLQRLRAAIALARAAGTSVEPADAADWVDACLAERQPGCTTVLYHSIVWQYLGDANRGRIRAALEKAGRRATTQAPLAWLRLEPSAQATPQLVLTLWPSGQERVLCTAHAHGMNAHWVQATSPAVR